MYIRVFLFLLITFIYSDSTFAQIPFQRLDVFDLQWVDNPQISPNAVQRFKKLVESKAYDNSAFHRVIKDTLVQAGDLEFGKKGSLNYAKIGTGKSGLGTINSEIDTPFDFKKGSVGLARSKNYNTEDSQFFIILRDEPLYETEYTPIGKVIYGLEALKKIKYLDKSQYVLRPDFINSIRMLIN